MNGWQRVLGWLILLAVLAAGTAAAAEGIVVTIPERVTVTGPRIQLGSLASFSGGTPDEYRVLQQLALGPTPQPGQTRVFSKEYLDFQLKQHPLKQPVSLQMGQTVTVQAAATAITHDAIEAEIMKLLPVKAGISRWIELNNLPETIWLSQGDWRIQAVPVGNMPDFGNVLFQVRLENGAEQRVLNVSGRIHAKARIYQAARNLPKLTALKAEDLVPVEMELKFGDELTGDCSGWRTIKSLRAGRVLRMTDLQQVPLVVKGHPVKVTVKDSGVEIAIAGVALADGWNGDSIPIVNPSSNKKFQAKVCGPGATEVIIP